MIIRMKSCIIFHGQTYQWKIIRMNSKCAGQISRINQLPIRHWVVLVKEGISDLIQVDRSPARNDLTPAKYWNKAV